MDHKEKIIEKLFYEWQVDRNLVIGEYTVGKVEEREYQEEFEKMKEDVYMALFDKEAPKTNWNQYYE